jgi:putative ABC transport system substrate-binding protein
MMTRREVLRVLGAGALAVPFASIAQQQTKIWRVGFLALPRVEFVDTDYYYGPFRSRMRELGYIEGKNLVIEWRSAEGNLERLPGLAAELVNLKVDVILAAGGSTPRPAQQATSTIPIVFAGFAEPVEYGLIKSLARPGGNITGVTNLNYDMGPKLLEMAISMVPKLSHAAVLWNLAVGGDVAVQRIQAAAQKTGVKILPLDVRSAADIEQAFSTMIRQKVGAAIVTRDAFLNRQVRLIATLAAKHRLPVIGGIREFVEAGGLMSYGSNLTVLYRRAADYVDKILKGAKPGDLPVEQPTTFELVINAKTAKALGLTIPYALRISANQVIE